MRPRINKGHDIAISYSEMNKYLTENKCYGITVSFLSSKIALYKFLMMYRDSRKPPVEAEVEVSLVSKRVIRTYIGGKMCDSITEFMDKCKWR